MQFFWRDVIRKVKIVCDQMSSFRWRSGCYVFLSVAFERVVGFRFVFLVRLFVLGGSQSVLVVRLLETAFTKGGLNGRLNLSVR